ncbi:MAG: DASS family sodium-coupled anion symporter [Erythrobacter sp.]|nr:DASS family sodium-coupled anion symporter [Erythrobacter sp.]NCQ63352.1 DASS family sodium-coupled anion symporter [Alphaproteobacteria bacterium]
MGKANAEPADGDDAARPAYRQWIMRFLGLALAFGVWLALGAATQLSADGRIVAAIGTLMAVWWITEALPLSVTSLLPIVLIPALTQRTIGETTAPYASPIVFLFLGGFLIAIAMEKCNLHRRIALMTLRRVGTEPRMIVLGMMIATGFLSMWVSNTATTLMMLPIGFSILALVGTGDRANAEPGSEPGEQSLPDDPRLRGFGVCLMLAIAWSANIGGLGTLLGSPPNAIVAGYAAVEYGRNIGFLDWMMVGVPIAAVFTLVAWVLMTRVLYPFDLPKIEGGRDLIEGQIRKLGRMGRAERMVLLAFGSAAFFWIVPGLIAEFSGAAEDVWWAQLNDTAIAIGAGIALFLLPGDRKGEAVLEWSDAEKGVPWGVLLLFGGGLSLASAVAASGLDAWLGQQVTGLGALPPILLIAAVVAIVMFLTEVTSNTATAATFIPILGGVALGLGIDPMGLLIPAALAATCAFMLPVGTPPNAIVFSTGVVSIRQMATGGVVLNLVGIILITLIYSWIGPAVFG